MSRILVTGGAGFIGSHLTRRLLSDGHTVIALDDLSTGARDNMLRHSRLRLVEHDVREPFNFDVQRVYHLACPASPVAYQADAVRTIETAVMGTKHSLRSAQLWGARTLIASTSEVYGDPDISPQPESYWGRVNSVGPRACYDEGKRCAEALAVSWAEQYGTEVRIARIFNTYGPRMAAGDGRLIPNFITQALRGEPITVYGNGEQTRSLCYVSDLVEGLVRLMEHEPKSWEAKTPIMNLGNPDERTIISVAKDVQRLLGGEIVHKPLPVDDPRQRKPAIGLAREKLKWEPTVGYEEGLGRTIEWFRDNR